MQNPSQADAIFFANVPIDPPGSTLTRTFRITNIRADAAALGTGLYNSGQITANLSVNGATSVSINNPQIAVAFIAPGMTASVAGSPGVSSPIRLLEGSAGAWKTKNLSFTVGDHNGTPGNAVFQSGSLSYTGGSNYPVDVAQNVPNANFATESGYQWQNNAQNAPPSPNPPLGFGLPAATGGGLPLQAAEGINQAGVADSGTRVMLRFGNIPAGASVQVPPVLYLFPQGFSHNGNPAQFQSGASGVMVLTQTDSFGAGAFNPAGGTFGPNGTAVYEILYADPSKLEYADVPFTLLSAPPGTALQVQAGFAPQYTDPFASLPSGSYPVPRFVDRSASEPCSSNVCLTAFPSQQNNPAPTGSSMICVMNAGVPPLARAEGLAEPVGDLVLNCTGGTPTLAGQPVPQGNLILNFTTNVAEKLTATGGFSEALLIVDEPNSAVQPSRPILNCGQVGAPDGGQFGPGACSILGNGDATRTYDGAANGYGSGGATCDGSGGRPAANSYGCGRPNVYQGRIGGPGNPNQLNTITFANVPIDPPGLGNTRTLRITNIRLNTASVGVSQSFFSVTIADTAGITLTGAVINNPQQVVAYIESGLVTSVSGAGSPGSNVNVKESFSSAWKARNFSFAIGDHNGTPGNTTLPLGFSYYVYDGATNSPLDIAQNVPGAIYNTEDIFTWQNNGLNSPPSPNPPVAVGTLNVFSFGGPLASAGFGGLNTGIGNSGVANAGTRLALRFGNIPVGASVQVPQIVNVTQQGSSGQTITGVLALTNTDATGSGPFTPGSGTLSNGSNLAVYEVLWADPFSNEQADIPFTLVNAPQGSSIQVSAGFAPFFSAADAGSPSSSYPLPRFVDNLAYLPCISGPCISVFPNQGINSGPVNVALSGGPILSGAQVKLSATGRPDIFGGSLSNPSLSALTSAISILTRAAPGARDVVITPQTGNPFVLAGAFSILAPPPCSFTVGPLNTTFLAAGGKVLWWLLLRRPSVPGAIPPP